MKDAIATSNILNNATGKMKTTKDKMIEASAISN